MARSPSRRRPLWPKTRERFRAATRDMLLGDATPWGDTIAISCPKLIVLFGFFSLVLISVYWINEAVDLFDSA